MDRTRKVDSTNVALMKSVGFGAVFGMVTILLLTILFSFIMLSSDFIVTSLSVVSGFIVSLGAFFSGIFSARKFKSRGFLVGALSALLIFILLTLAGLLISEAITYMLLLKLCLMVVFGAVGGIVGINLKSRGK